jgi:hypothetical protein
VDSITILMMSPEIGSIILLIKNKSTKKYEKRPYQYKKQNNAANYIKKFNIPTVLTAMFTG